MQGIENKVLENKGLETRGKLQVNCQFESLIQIQDIDNQIYSNQNQNQFSFDTNENNYCKEKEKKIPQQHWNTTTHSKDSIKVAPTQPIIKPPNKIANSNTQNLIFSPTLIKPFKIFPLGTKNHLINFLHFSSGPTIFNWQFPHKFLQFVSIPSFIVKNQVIFLIPNNPKSDAFQKRPQLPHTIKPSQHFGQQIFSLHCVIQPIGIRFT